MDAAVQRVRGFQVGDAKARDTAECRLDVAARAAETVVQIEVTKSGIEIVPEHQADRPLAKPNALGIAGRPVDGLGRLGEFIDLVLGVLRCVRTGWRSRFVLIGRPEIAALSGGQSSPKQGDERKRGDTLEDSGRKTPDHSKHEVPERSLGSQNSPVCRGSVRRKALYALKSQAGSTSETADPDWPCELAANAALTRSQGTPDSMAKFRNFVQHGRGRQVAAPMPDVPTCQRTPPYLARLSRTGIDDARHPEAAA